MQEALPAFARRKEGPLPYIVVHVSETVPRTHERLLQAGGKGKDGKATGFVPGGASLHSCMTPHGPDAKVREMRRCWKRDLTRRK